MKSDKNKKQSLTSSFNAAIDGIIYTFKSERNMKIHYLLASMVLLISLFFNFSKIEFALLAIVILLVIICEMINTSIEKVVDSISTEYSPLAKISKDVAAGSVLVSSLGACTVGYILFFDKLELISEYLINSIRSSSLHTTFIVLVIVLICVIALKSNSPTGTHLRGGMPSGHSALAWAMATCITFICEDTIASSLAYLMAVLVSQSRIEGRIHTIWEVLAGSSLGILITILIFQFKLSYFI